MKQFLLIVLYVVFEVTGLYAQNGLVELIPDNNIGKAIEQLRSNSNIDADSAYSILSGWNEYPILKQTGRDYLFYYDDAVFGKVPVRVYIPSTYKNTQKSPCVLLLHGAVGGSHFSDVNAPEDFDVLYHTLAANNYIVIRPIADRDKDFNWVVNKSGLGETYVPNPTFKTFCGIVASLKKTLNIDDNRLFAMGHSDGSDGAVGLGVYTPDMLAGVLAYNSMLNNLFAHDFYIRNIQNRPFYVVHSSLDNLRPIATTRMIIDSLLKFGDNILYKEYTGYQHFDKHLDIDIPFACVFLKGASRNPFRSNICWEADRAGIYSNCDWLKITAVNTEMPQAAWHKPLNVTASFNKNERQFSYPYYHMLNKSAAVSAKYNKNIFDIKTSGVTEIELLISPVMINLESDIVVIVNGKQAYEGKVKANKDFILNGFKNTMDRDALWVNSIKVKVD